MQKYSKYMSVHIKGLQLCFVDEAMPHLERIWGACVWKIKPKLNTFNFRRIDRSTENATTFLHVLWESVCSLYFHKVTDWFAQLTQTYGSKHWCSLICSHCKCVSQVCNWWLSDNPAIGMPVVDKNLNLSSSRSNVSLYLGSDAKLLLCKGEKKTKWGKSNMLHAFMQTQVASCRGENIGISGLWCSHTTSDWTHYCERVAVNQHVWHRQMLATSDTSSTTLKRQGPPFRWWHGQCFPVL